MPEHLPVAEDIKKVASREKKRLKAEQQQLKPQKSRSTKGTSS
jgi:hypothetical protein